MEAAFQQASREGKLGRRMEHLHAERAVELLLPASDLVIAHGISKGVGERDLLASQPKLLTRWGLSRTSYRN